LTDDSRTVVIDLSLGNGQHEVEVFAKIAGESDGPDSLVTSFNSSCADEGGCAVASTSGRAAPVAALLALLVLGVGRRRRPASLTPNDD
jgi:MYXO-CTERM domain-containing protein